MLKTLLKFSISIIFFIATVHASDKRIMQVGEILDLAEKNSPLVTAAEFQEIAANKAINISLAGYYPVFNFEAIDSRGFPGSNSWIGVKGLMGSPFRKGLAGGLVVKQTIWDFGRTAADVKASKYTQEYAKQNIKVTSYEVKQLALETYYECARFRTLEEIWSDLSRESSIITTEVKKFVSTGQRSIVDKYLSEAQTEEASTAKAYYTESLKGVIHQLSVLTGLPDHSFTCPSLLSQRSLSLNDPESPFIARAKAELNIAAAKLVREKADLFPKIVTVASMGGMQETHLVDRKEYSIGLGVIVPLFDLTTIGGIQRASAIVSAKCEDVQAQIQFIDEMNAKFDTVIDASAVRLNHLSKELKLAIEAFELAKKRYFALEGELIDSREAFRNLARAKVETEDTRANLLIARGSKMLLNGAGN